MPTVPSDDTNQQILEEHNGGISKYPNKIPGLTDAEIEANNARRLHLRSAEGEELLPHDHQFLSEYHRKMAKPEGAYDGLDKD